MKHRQTYIHCEVWHLAVFKAYIQVGCFIASKERGGGGIYLCPAVRHWEWGFLKCLPPTLFLPLTFMPVVPLLLGNRSDTRGTQTSVTSLFLMLKLLFLNVDLGSPLLSLSLQSLGGLQWRIHGEISSLTGGVSTAAEAESTWVRACGHRASSTEVRLLTACVQSELFLCKHCCVCTVFTESQTAKVRHSEFLKRYREKCDVPSCSLNINLSCPQIWSYWSWATASAASGSPSPVWGWWGACVWSTPSGPRSGWTTEGSGPQATTPKQSHRITTTAFTVRNVLHFPVTAERLSVYLKVRLTGEYNEHKDHSRFHFWISEWIIRKNIWVYAVWQMSTFSSFKQVQACSWTRRLLHSLYLLKL